MSKKSAIAELRALGMTDAIMTDLLASIRLYPHSTRYDLALADSLDAKKLTLDISIGQRGWLKILVHMPRSPAPASRALASLPAVLDPTTWPTGIPTLGRVHLEWEDKSRSWRYIHETYNGILGDYTIKFVSQIWVGMAALWFLGKLADAYAARLADWMAETTVAALRRVRATKSDKDQLVVIKVPEGVTMMILPMAGLTDEAKEAFIDLNPNADEVRGKLLSWDSQAGAWLPQNEAIPLPPDL